MIFREINVRFFSDLSICSAEEGKTQARMRTIKFDLPIRIGNSLGTYIIWIHNGCIIKKIFLENSKMPEVIHIASLRIRCYIQIHLSCKIVPWVGIRFHSIDEQNWRNILKYTCVVCLANNYLPIYVWHNRTLFGLFI